MKDKIILSIFALLFLSAANAMEIEMEDFKSVEFTQLTAALTKRVSLEIQGEEYAVVKNAPRLNPCYSDDNSSEPYLIRLEQVQLIPQCAKFFWVGTKRSENNEYVTLGYTSGNNPHWETIDAEALHKGNVYWNLSCSKPIFGHNRTVNFLLKKIG